MKRVFNFINHEGFLPTITYPVRPLSPHTLATPPPQPKRTALAQRIVTMAPLPNPAGPTPGNRPAARAFPGRRRQPSQDVDLSRIIHLYDSTPSSLRVESLGGLSTPRWARILIGTGGWMNPFGSHRRRTGISPHGMPRGNSGTTGPGSGPEVPLFPQPPVL